MVRRSGPEVTEDADGDGSDASLVRALLAQLLWSPSSGRMRRRRTTGPSAAQANPPPPLPPRSGCWPQLVLPGSMGLPGPLAPAASAGAGRRALAERFGPPKRRLWAMLRTMSSERGLRSPRIRGWKCQNRVSSERRRREHRSLVPLLLHNERHPGTAGGERAAAGGGRRAAAHRRWRSSGLPAAAAAGGDGVRVGTGLRPIGGADIAVPRDTSPCWSNPQRRFQGDCGEASSRATMAGPPRRPT